MFIVPNAETWCQPPTSIGLAPPLMPSMPYACVGWYRPACPLCHIPYACTCVHQNTYKNI